MGWGRLDDKFHENDKANAVPPAALGLWVLAKSWCSDNHKTEGFIPRWVLGRWDDANGYDVDEHARSLVEGRLWYETERNGRPGYVFHDWDDYQISSAAQSFAAHVRWHEKKGLIHPECPHCPTEPSLENDASDADAYADAYATQCIDMPNPNPTPIPNASPNAEALRLRDATHRATTPDANAPVADADATRQPDRFSEFWQAYPRKADKRKAQDAWKRAAKRADPEAIIEGAIRYRDDPNREDAYTKYAQGWLNGDRWQDPPLPARSQPPNRYHQGQQVIDNLRTLETINAPSITPGRLPFPKELEQ